MMGAIGSSLHGNNKVHFAIFGSAPDLVNVGFNLHVVAVFHLGLSYCYVVGLCGKMLVFS